MAGNLDTKITLTAVDKVSPTLRTIGQSFQRMKMAAQGISASFSNVGSAASDFGAKLRNLTLVAGLAGGAVLSLARTQGQYAEMLQQTSEKTGFSTQSLQKWQFVAKLNNLELNDMVLGMRGLSKVMAKASVDPKDEMAQWFKRNKIAIKDAKGNLLPLENVMMNISEVFKNSPDGASKMATAMKLLGRPGLSLIPVLNLGKAKFAELIAEAQKYGFILTDEMVKAQSTFDDSLDRTEWSLSQLKMSIGSKLIPILQPMVEGFRDWLNVNRELVATKIVGAIQEIAAGFSMVGKAIYAVGVVLAPVVDMFGGFSTVIATIAGVYIGGLVLSFARLAMALFAVIPSIIAFNAALFANPIGLIILSIGALAAAVSFMDINWSNAFEAVKHTIDSFAKWLGNKAFQIQEIATKMLSPLTNAGKSIGNNLYDFMNPSDYNPTAPTQVKPNNDVVKTDQAITGLNSNINMTSGATQGLGDSFKQAGSNSIQALNPVLNVVNQLNAAVNGIKSTLQSMSANPINIRVQSTISGAPAGGASTPAVGKSAMATQPKVAPLASNQPSNQHLSVHMKIDADNRPKIVSARSSGKLDFAANTGMMV